MLGLLNLLIMGGIGAASEINKSIENGQRKQETIQRRANDIKNGKIDEDWYVAEGAQLRRISTNEKVIVSTVDMNGKASKYSNYQNGDRIMYTNNWGYIRNLSAEQRELDFKNAKANSNGRKAVLVSEKGVYGYPDEKNPRWRKEIELGQEFRDVKTGEKYYLRKFEIEKGEKNGKKIYMTTCFYMNRKGLLVGLSDYQYNHFRESINENIDLMNNVNQFMNEFNNAQKNGGWEEWCHTTQSKSMFLTCFFCITHKERELIEKDNSKEFIKSI